MMTHLENVFLIFLYHQILVLKIQIQKDGIVREKTPVRRIQIQKDVNLQHLPLHQLIQMTQVMVIPTQEIQILTTTMMAAEEMEMTVEALVMLMWILEIQVTWRQR
jgi:hypothetical protein